MAEQGPVTRPANDVGFEELLDALLDVFVDAVCQDENLDFDTCGITSFTDAARLLAQYGEVEIIEDMGGRGVLARLVQHG